MTDKLLNCPFCGGEAETEWHHGYWGVRCQSCYAEVTADGMNDAVTAWNTRKHMDRIIERLKEVAFVDFEEEYVDNGECLVYLQDAIEIVKGVQNE